MANRGELFMRRDSCLGGALACAVLVCTLVGCKKGGGPSPTGAPSAEKPANEAAVDGQMLADAEKRLDAAYQGTDRALPSSALKPLPGKKVWIISPGQIGESASIPTNAAKEAGEAVGWKMTLYDAKLDLTNFSLGIRQAVAAKADGIILHAIDCALVKQPLIEARAAKVKILAYYALDCDNPSVKSEPLYDGSVNFGSQFGDYASLTRTWGAAKADWVISQDPWQSESHPVQAGRAPGREIHPRRVRAGARQVQNLRDREDRGFHPGGSRSPSCSRRRRVRFCSTPKPTRFTCPTTRRCCSASAARWWSRAETTRSR